MQKYYSSMRLVLLGLLATLAVSVAIISCGNGEVTKESDGDYVWLNSDINGDVGLINMCYNSPGSKPYCEQLLIDYCSKVGCISSSSEEVLPSSSSEEELPSSSSEEELPSSSSEEPSSSSAAPSSSSSAEPPVSSSSGFSEPLTCVPASNTVAVRDTIGIPTVKCGATVLTVGINYEKGEIIPWVSRLDKGVYELKAEAICGGGLQETSCGKIYVGNNLECSAIPAGTKGTVGVAITPAPAVKCNGDAVTTGLVWAPANLTPTEADAGKSIDVEVTACSGETESCGKVEVAALSSSSVELSSSSVDVSSSSSVGNSSSSSIIVEPSSSSVTQSSSSNVLACNMTATTGTVGVAISPAPTATCNGTAVTAGLTWTPANFIPIAAGALAVTVSASSGVCSGKTATCTSINVVAPTPVCTKTATTVKAGTAITPTPTVTCNSTSVAANLLTWTPPNLTFPTTTTVGDNPVSAVVDGTGPCSGKTATCGNINVTAAGGCAYQATWCGGISSSSVVKGASSNATFNGDPKCVFIKGINTPIGDANHLNVSSGPIMVNGTNVPKDDLHYKDIINSLTKADGGYYIYIPQGVYIEIKGAITGDPVCN